MLCELYVLDLGMSNVTYDELYGACLDGFLFFFQAEDGIRDLIVTGVQTCALPISDRNGGRAMGYAVRGRRMIDLMWIGIYLTVFITVADWLLNIRGL